MKTEKMFILIFFALIIMVTISCTSSIEPVNTENGYAIKGYDTVSYFTEGKPVEGQAKFQYQWNGATWLFSSKDNMELFVKDPEKYAPQYGGY